MRLKAWLKLYLPLAAIIVAVFALYARRESDRAVEQRIEREQARLRMAETRLSEALARSIVDLRVIGAAPAVRSFVEGEDSAPGMTTMLFSSFVGENWNYDELCLLDTRGGAGVCVVRTPEGPRSLPSVDRATWQDDPLWTRALDLRPRQVAVARFALDEERGQVVVPHEPVLRMATRVSSGDGQAVYVVVATLRGAVLLKGLHELLAYGGGGDIWVLDQDGYWILGPDPNLNWGAQLDPSHRLGTRLPELAGRLLAGPGAIEIDGALYVHRHTEPLAGLDEQGLVVAPPTFDLVAHIPADRMPSAWPRDLALAMTAVLILAAAGCAILARVRARSLDSERRERALLEEHAAANELRSWIKDHVYQLSVQVHGARDLASFGAAMLAELAPVLGLAAACAYARQDGQARPIAGFALSADYKLRAFAPGEGLVGEALRARQNVRLCPAPAGYLDLSGGAGDGSACEIRILPLWVHEHTVGVLELALCRKLDERQEEFLRQALPVLALNLEGLIERPTPPQQPAAA